MSRLRSYITISADGYAAGPNQSVENPLGEGGEALHEWALATASWREAHGQPGGEHNVDADLIAKHNENLGAHIMGRNMFGGGPGGWDESWKGWWGDDPPFHTPVYVLTHHAREPVPMEGGTTFHFVTDGIESALEQARDAAGDRDVLISGGATTIQQYIAAGLLEELHVHIAPIVLGGGTRLFEHIGTPKLEILETVASPAATHVKYRLG